MHVILKLLFILEMSKDPSLTGKTTLSFIYLFFFSKVKTQTMAKVQVASLWIRFLDPFKSPQWTVSSSTLSPDFFLEHS